MLQYIHPDAHPCTPHVTYPYTPLLTYPCAPYSPPLWPHDLLWRTHTPVPSSSRSPAPSCAPYSPPLRPQDLLWPFDSEGRGWLLRGEVLQLVSELLPSATESEVRALAAMLDLDGSGRLHADVLVEVRNRGVVGEEGKVVIC